MAPAICMVQGMAFLSKKGFNPHNQVNRKQVYEAQQQSKLEKERARQREEQLKREREDEELCAARHNGDGSQAQLRFMYDAPPGLKTKEEKQQKEESTTNSNDLTQVQPGDDPAAAAFRRMLAASASSAEEVPEGSNEAHTGDEEKKLGFAPVLQGSTLERELERSNDTRSALEKAVGRKDRGSVLTLEEQVARFPQLKKAPMAKGMSATDVNVSFKPLGAELRNVKCLACGVWGHSRGDRECQLTGWDPFSVRPPESTAASSSTRPTQTELKSGRSTADDDNARRKSSRSDSDDASSASSSSSSDDDSRRKRKRKHRSKHERKESKRSRRHRSRSPSRRSKSHKSSKNKRSRRDD